MGKWNRPIKLLSKNCQNSSVQKKTHGDECLPAALWADQVTLKVATRHSPFELVYGTQPFLPSKYFAPTFDSVIPCDYDNNRIIVACS